VYCFEFACCFGYESADLPVTRVEAEGDGGAVFGSETAVSAQNEDFGAEDAGGIPTHANVLA
jgi:hypothetical protein